MSSHVRFRQVTPGGGICLCILHQNIMVHRRVVLPGVFSTREDRAEVSSGLPCGPLNWQRGPSTRQLSSIYSASMIVCFSQT